VRTNAATVGGANGPADSKCSATKNKACATPSSPIAVAAAAAASVVLVAVAVVAMDSINASVVVGGPVVDKAANACVAVDRVGVGERDADGLALGATSTARAAVITSAAAASAATAAAVEGRCGTKMAASRASASVLGPCVSVCPAGAHARKRKRKRVCVCESE
jgi:hypothetical protein